MPIPSTGYRYFSNYGVEPFNENTLGAFYTNDNFVLTLWRAEDKVSPPNFINIGEIVVPMSNSETPADNIRSFFEQPMHSRVAARLNVNITDDDAWGDDQAIMIAVCNPPVELKQQLKGSVTFAGGDPLDITNFEFSKGQTGQFCFDVEMFTNPVTGLNDVDGVSTDNAQGQYINIDYFTNPDPSYLPFLRTSGVDGQTPEFFDPYTEAGMQAYIAAVNTGRFYVPVILPSPLTSNRNHVFNIRWPYSASRGS